MLLQQEMWWAGGGEQESAIMIHCILFVYEHCWQLTLTLRRVFVLWKRFNLRVAHGRWSHSVIPSWRTFLWVISQDTLHQGHTWLWTWIPLLHVHPPSRMCGGHDTQRAVDHAAVWSCCRLSPPGVVPNRGRCPRWIVDGWNITLGSWECDAVRSCSRPTAAPRDPTSQPQQMSVWNY